MSLLALDGDGRLFVRHDGRTGVLRFAGSELQLVGAHDASGSSFSRPARLANGTLLFTARELLLFPAIADRPPISVAGVMNKKGRAGNRRARLTIELDEQQRSLSGESLDQMLYAQLGIDWTELEDKDQRSLRTWNERFNRTSGPTTRALALPNSLLCVQASGIAR